LFTKHTVYSIPTPEGKPVCLAYEGREKPTHTDTQQHSDTHTHTQQEDTTRVYSTEDTHTTTHTDNVVDTYTDNVVDTHTDNVVDTHTLTHSDVVYDTLDIDTYIHSMIDIH
jgi:hypothetical protein